MPSAALLRLRYVVGNCARRLSRPWRESTVRPEQAMTIFACSFGDRGWQHLRRTLAEHEAQPDIDLRNTTLWRFLKDFRPTSISALAGVHDEPPLPLFVYPWGTFNDSGATNDKEASQSRFCGPSSDAFVEVEYTRTLALHAALRIDGYRPYQYPHSFVGGTWLTAIGGERRFVVMQGNHRMASLAHLGVAEVAVRTGRFAIAEVREADLDRWPLVRTGRCSKAHARQVFGLFFRESGWHVERLLRQPAAALQEAGA
jgi:hypothetical protein